MNCDEARLRLDEAHDEAARSHLASCGACREFAAELNTLTLALRALPQSPFPADALDAVWKKTSRSLPASSWLTAGWTRLAAALVVTAVSTAALYYVSAPSPPTPGATELAKASAEAELVLAYAAKALAATRDATTDRVFASKVSPAVRGEVAPSPRRP